MDDKYIFQNYNENVVRCAGKEGKPALWQWGKIIFIRKYPVERSHTFHRGPGNKNVLHPKQK